MGSQTKIQLSALERELIKNKEWILTKRSIINKVCELFGALNETYKTISTQDSLPELYKSTGGKISKGENYEGLPYVMLDYPAFFSKENIFAIRTLFWWGNFFSITLHLSGKQYTRNFSGFLGYLREYDFFICINEKEWEHNFGVLNYIPARELDHHKLEQISRKNFFKISKRLGLDHWNEAPGFLEKSFREITGFLKISFQAGEKVPLPGFPTAGSDL